MACMAPSGRHKKVGPVAVNANIGVYLLQADSGILSNKSLFQELLVLVPMT